MLCLSHFSILMLTLAAKKNCLCYKVIFSRIKMNDWKAFDDDSMDDLIKNASTFTDFNLLLAVQIFFPNSDSKDFIDRPTKRPIKDVRSDFVKLQKELGIDRFVETERTHDNKDNRETMLTYIIKLQPHAADKDKIRAMETFLDENFGVPGSDLCEHPLEDYLPEQHRKQMHERRYTRTEQDVEDTKQSFSGEKWTGIVITRPSVSIHSAGWKVQRILLLGHVLRPRGSSSFKFA